MKKEEVKAALIGLQDAISSSDAPSISRNLAALDQALALGFDGLDAQLKHYLKNRSYQKALAYISGASSIEAGVCSKKPTMG